MIRLLKRVDGEIVERGGEYTELRDALIELEARHQLPFPGRWKWELHDGGMSHDEFFTRLGKIAAHEPIRPKEVADVMNRVHPGSGARWLRRQPKRTISHENNT